MTTTTTPNYLDSLLGGGGALRVEGNGITGQQVAAVVHLGEGTTGDYDVASQTVEVSATPVSDLELGLYYYGVGAAGLNSVSTFTSGGPVRELGYDAVVSPSTQKFYTAYPTSWGHAFVVLAGAMVEMLAPRAITIEGQAYTLLESAATASGANLGYYVTRYASVPGSGGSGAVNHVLFVDGTNGTSGGDGSLGNAFLTPTEAIAHAVANSIRIPIIAIAPGLYIGDLTVPEALRGIILSEFVAGSLASTAEATTVRINGDILCTSYQGISRVELNRIFLNGNIVSTNPAAAPAQLNLSARDSQLIGNLTASQILVSGQRVRFVSGAITASSGYVALDVDRFTRKSVLDAGASVTISPPPSILLSDGPLTVLQGGDPGGGGDGTLAVDATKQVFNFPDGRRVWTYTRHYCVTLVNGVTNSSIVITESEHGGEGTAVRVSDGGSGYTDISYPIAHVKVEYFGALPSTGGYGPGGFSRVTWEGSLDKDAASGTWTNRDQLSLVSPSWQTSEDLGQISASMNTIGPTYRDIRFNLEFNGPQSPPPYSMVKVTINGTGKFAL